MTAALALDTTAAPSRSDARCLSDVEVAKLIRKELKAAFPAVKFSVRSTSSINIRYTDGPTIARVQAVVSKFEGKGYDGMTDCTSYAAPFFYNGEWVYTYCYVFVSRKISAAFTARVAAAVANRYGLDVPAMVENWIRPTHAQDLECGRATGQDWGSMIFRAAADRSSVSADSRDARTRGGLSR